MSFADRLIARSLPLAPRPIVERIASRYLAGEDEAAALQAARRLAAAGVLATYDVLGEFVHHAAEADRTLADYERLLVALRAEGVGGGVSVKLSSVGLLQDEEACYRRLERLVVAAGEAGAARFVRIDMEDATTTDATLRLYERLRAVGHERVGIVVQACLRRSVGDVRRLVERGIADVRVCKGIYIESPTIAHRDREVIRHAYVRLCEEILAGGGRLGAATHDDRLVYEVGVLADRHDPAGERHEYQMLLGVRESLRDVLVANAARVRVYIPFGAKGYAYSIRRLQENPTIARHVIRDLAVGLTGKRR